MDTKEILKFCLEKGLLLDKDLLTFFSEELDSDSFKIIIEKIKQATGQKIITKELFEENKERVESFFSGISKESREKLKIRLGLTIEISKEIEKRVQINEGSAKMKRAEKELEGVKILSMHCLPGKKFDVEDFVNFYRTRFNEMKRVIQEKPAMDNPISIDKLNGAKQGVSIIGMVFDKKTTKNKNILIEVEDLTGKIKILVNQGKEELFKKAEEIALDSVIGFKCSGNKDILFANEIIFPETSLLERKKSPNEEHAVFISDVHYGSKNFMKENFDRFIDFMNGNLGNSQEALKIKYLFIVGDLVTGIGNYPHQERDLAIKDLEDQFTGISEFLGKLRKDLKIIISPGNHEGVRLMEPQPLYDEKYAWALYDMDNVILTENPAMLNIGAEKDFSGFNVLLYHGFSFPFFVDNVPRLTKERAMNSPDKIMEYLLKHRHLAPTHGSAQYFPGLKDIHFIKDIPDIFVSGHTHKSAITYHNNILVISGSSWETLTPYQEKFGNTPDHCKVPLLNLKTREVKILDFE
ncbi:metallophosphoesterase [Candidatus Pacearchaeota archaeon]|nr:metallophosphoesterase [Candidatus Pacearchaeota archaeon]